MPVHYKILLRIFFNEVVCLYQNVKGKFFEMLTERTSEVRCSK